MKFRNFLFTAIGGCIILSSALPIEADNKEPQNTPVSTPIIVAKKRDIVPGRPKAPSRQSVDCLYFDGTISVAFLIPEGECTMTVTDSQTGISMQYIFPTEEPAEIYVSQLTGAYIEFDTEAGNSYEGWLSN